MELDRENTTDTTSAYDTDALSYEETVSDLSTLEGPAEQANKTDDSKANETGSQGKSVITSFRNLINLMLQLQHWPV